MDQVSNERNQLIDVLKGIAVGSTLLCHAVQRALPTGSYETNSIYIITCWYHMPLFCVLSGYVLGLSNATLCLTTVKKKFLGLIIPTIIWHYIIWILHEFDFVGIKRFRDFPSTFKQYTILLIDNPIFIYWFLWVIFIMTILVLGIVKIFKCNYVNITVVLIIICFYVNRSTLLRKINLLGGYYLGQYIPFFVCGYLYYIWHCKIRNIVLLSGGVISGAVCLISNRQIHYYFRAICIVIMLYYVSKLFIWKTKYLKKFFVIQGKYSLQIYLISLCIMNLGFGEGYLRVVTIYVCVTAICIIIAEKISRTKVIRKILFGR